MVLLLLSVAATQGATGCANEPIGTFHLQSESLAINLTIWDEAFSWQVAGEKSSSDCGERYSRGGEYVFSGAGMTFPIEWPLGDGTTKEMCSITGRLKWGNLDVSVVTECKVDGNRLTEGPVVRQNWRGGMTCARDKNGKTSIEGCGGHLPEPPESCYQMIF